MMLWWRMRLLTECCDWVGGLSSWFCAFCDIGGFRFGGGLVWSDLAWYWWCRVGLIEDQLIASLWLGLGWAWFILKVLR